MFEVRPATLSDIPEVLSVLQDAAKWQVQTGRLNQWDASKFTDTWLRDAVAENALVVAHDQGKVIGSIMHSRKTSEAWLGCADRALYLSKLCVLRDRTSQYVGESLLRWCDIHAAKAGLKAVRLDCPDSPGFINYYLRQQYVLHGRGSRGYYHYVQFEKSLK